MDIASLTEFPGMKSDIFEQLVKAGIRGIIFRASGAGDPNIAPEEKAKEFKNLREGFKFLQDEKIPIVVTTQAPDGVASMDVNDPGRLALELGAIPAWDMSIEAMTVKLGWLLGREFKYKDICWEMTRSLKGEIVLARE